MELGSVTDRAHETGRKVGESAAFEHTVRGGIVTYGLVHLVMAYLVLQIAFRDRDNKASATGALRQMAEQSPGRALLWVVGVGLAALVLWRLLEAAFGYRDKEGWKRTYHRLAAAGKALVYAALAFSAMRIATGNGGGGTRTDGYTAQVMSMPLGTWVVAAVGLGIVAVAVVTASNGVTDGYRDNLERDGVTGVRGTVLTMLARAGFLSKGAALLVVGGLFVWAAITHDPQKSGGLDAALQRLAQAPAGPALLAVIAVGFGCYGLYCLGWARHLDQ